MFLCLLYRRLMYARDFFVFEKKKEKKMAASRNKLAAIVTDVLTPQKRFESNLIGLGQPQCCSAYRPARLLRQEQEYSVFSVAFVLEGSQGHGTGVCFRPSSLPWTQAFRVRLLFFSGLFFLRAVDLQFKIEQGFRLDWGSPFIPGFSHGPVYHGRAVRIYCDLLPNPSLPVTCPNWSRPLPLLSLL